METAGNNAVETTGNNTAQLSRNANAAASSASKKLRLGWALCGSYCTFDNVFKEAEKLSEAYDITPIMSENVASTDTRFGKAADFRARLERLSGKEIVDSIVKAEPIGPRGLLDILLIAPCTGNTLGKLANGITDSSVTMAAKAHLRNDKPVVIAVSTNDGLSASAQNIGKLMNRKNIYFVPFLQDDPVKKQSSLVADMSRFAETIELAVKNTQIQPILTFG